MGGVWCGHWARDLVHTGPELFLYSKTDFYTPYKYLFTLGHKVFLDLEN